jgi:hypothetical protein
MQIITVTIDEQGEATVETEGMAGKGCAAIHEAFARATGKATSIEHKREFSAPIIAANRLKQGK